MNWYKTAKERGLYNTDEGNSHRNSNLKGQQDSFQQHLDENELIEGDAVKTLSRMFQDKDFTAYTAFIEKLKGQGYSQARIDSMISRSYSTKDVNNHHSPAKVQTTELSSTQKRKLNNPKPKPQAPVQHRNLTQLNRLD